MQKSQEHQKSKSILSMWEKGTYNQMNHKKTLKKNACFVKKNGQFHKYMWSKTTGKEDYKPLEGDRNEFGDRRGKCSKKNEWLICFSAH